MTRQELQTYIRKEARVEPEENLYAVIRAYGCRTEEVCYGLLNPSHITIGVYNFDQTLRHRFNPDFHIQEELVTNELIRTSYHTLLLQ